MRPAVSRIFEVSRPRFPLRAAMEPWEVLVLVLMALILVGVGRDGVDLAAIPFTGWMHP
jgi:hypothetical protein